MSRRQSDKTQSRVLLGVSIVAFLFALLSAYIGYKAIRISGLAIETLDTYNDVLRAVLSKHSITKQPENF